MIQQGDAIWYPGTGPNHSPGSGHYCVVVKVDEENDDLYSVPISSEMLNFDEKCIINPGEGCAYIKVKSFAAYFHAKKSSLKGVKAQITSRRISIVGHIPPSVFRRVMEGITRSEDTEPGFKKAFMPRPPSRRILEAK